MLLQPVRHGHIGERSRSLVDAQAGKLGDGERSERIARLVAALEGKVDFNVADAELAPSARGRGVMLAAKGQERKERVVRIEDGQPGLWEGRHQLTFATRQLFLRGEELHMHRADVGDDANRRPGQLREAGDVACALHPHLQHERGVLGLELEHRHRHAGLGVEVAGRAQHGVLALEDGGHHLFGRRLSVAAGDADHERIDALAHEARQRVKSVPCIAHENLDHAVGQLRAPLHHQRRRPASERIGDEAMSVRLAASEREEHPSLYDLAGVGVVRVERIADLGAADLATAGRLEELEESQSHMYMEPEVLIRRYAPG